MQNGFSPFLGNHYSGNEDKIQFFRDKHVAIATITLYELTEGNGV